MSLKISCFILLLSTSLQAQQVYTLQECLKNGLENNFEVRIVRNEQQISKNNASLGNAGLLPTLDLAAGYNGSLNDRNEKYSDGTSAEINDLFNQGANVGLNLGWTIFDGFSMQTNYKQLKAFAQLGDIATRLTIENMLADLSAEYFNFVHQNLRLSKLQYAVELSKERLRIAEAHYVIGSKSRLDFQQAKVDFNADSSQLIKQYETVHTSAVKLNRLMAEDDVSQAFVAADTMIRLNPILNQDDLWTKTLSVNAQLLMAEKNQTISALDLKAVQSRNYPYLKLNAGYGYTLALSNQATTRRQNTLGFNYGLTLGFPIYDGNNRVREQKNAKIALKNQQLKTQQLEMSLKADLATLWTAYTNNINLTNLEKENLIVAHDAYENAMERYKLGDLSGIELREAQNSLLEAEERLLQAQYNTKICEISLLQISGQITDYLN